MTPWPSGAGPAAASDPIPPGCSPAAAPGPCAGLPATSGAGSASAGGEPAGFASCWPGWSGGQSAKTADEGGSSADVGIGVWLESRVRRIEPGCQPLGWAPRAGTVPRKRGGRAVMPGLIDGHAHMDREGLKPRGALRGSADSRGVNGRPHRRRRACRVRAGAGLRSGTRPTEEGPIKGHEGAWRATARYVASTGWRGRGPQKRS
jgi:hypothetical protein